MQFNAKLEIDKNIVKNHGLNQRGRVQTVVDNETLKYMNPYTPFVNGNLVESAIQGTIVGSGKIEYLSPSARYLYYGKLMVSSETGSAYASKGEKKELTDIDLEYNKTEHPLAGPFWFERMKAKHKEDILQAAQEEAERGKK